MVFPPPTLQEPKHCNHYRMDVRWPQGKRLKRVKIEKERKSEEGGEGDEVGKV